MLLVHLASLLLAQGLQRCLASCQVLLRRSVFCDCLIKPCSRTIVLPSTVKITRNTIREPGAYFPQARLQFADQGMPSGHPYCAVFRSSPMILRSSGGSALSHSPHRLVARRRPVERTRNRALSSGIVYHN